MKYLGLKFLAFLGCCVLLAQAGFSQRPNVVLIISLLLESFKEEPE